MSKRGVLYVARRGEGPTTIFVHGGLLDHRIFASQFDAFSAHRLCIAPDLPGFGRSPAMPDPLNPTRLADALLDELADLEAPWDIVGLSLGGSVAAEMARRAPERVRSLCAIGIGGATANAAAQIAAARARYDSLDPSVFAAAFATRMLASGANPGHFALVADMAAATARDTVHALYDLLIDFPQSLPRISALPCPVLLMSGDEDGGANATGMAEIAAERANIRFVTIPASGHLATIENAVATNRALTDFWGEA